MQERSEKYENIQYNEKEESSGVEKDPVAIVCEKVKSIDVTIKIYHGYIT
jgi:hypothetical protein